MDDVCIQCEPNTNVFAQQSRAENQPFFIFFFPLVFQDGYSRSDIFISHIPSVLFTSISFSVSDTLAIDRPDCCTEYTQPDHCDAFAESATIYLGPELCRISLDAYSLVYIHLVILIDQCIYR